MKPFRTWAAALTLALAGGLVAHLLGQRAFSRLVRRDVAALHARAAPAPATVVSDAMLRDLPAPVQRYLRYTGVVGQPLVRTVHLRQTGRMRLVPGQPWLQLTAVQHFSVQPPGFVWDGTLHLGPLPLARGRDRYRDGAGHMLVKVGSLLTVANARGPEMDQGALVRYLGEMIWFPTALLGENLRFEPVGDAAARVTLTDHGRRVSGVMDVDAEGRLTRFVAERYRTVDGRYELATFAAEVLAYGERAGLTLPVRAQGVWKLPAGDFAYIDVTVTDVAYDAAQP
ncbi:MAG: hypothetical protein QJR03_12205 [Sphaerobacter sp.]|nr:hypothetical protein [Sphaerobacter sp.]